MANDFKTMFDGVMSLIGNIDDEEKGVQSGPVPLIAGSGGNIPQPPKAPVAAPAAAPQGDYFSGMFPEVPKDPSAPQSMSDFIDTSGAVGGLGHVPSVPAVEASPQMVPTERVPRTPKELKEFDDLVLKNKNNQNSISELNPFVNQEREAAVQKMAWEAEAKGAEARAGRVDVPSMLTPQQEELQGTLPQLERDIPQVELEPLQPQEDLVQVEVVTADEADSSAVEIGAENAAVVDEEIAKGDPEDPNFLQKLWGGIKSTVKGGFEDPAIRRSLFAYAASRAMGYDGATLAVQVLENEWRKEAATAQTDAANTRAFGKSEATRIAKARDASLIDYQNGTEIYDSQTKTNIKGTWSKDGQTFHPNDASVFAGADGVDVPSVSSEALMQMQGGRYSAGAGETLQQSQEAAVDQMRKTSNSVQSHKLSSLALDADIPDHKRAAIKGNLEFALSEDQLIEFENTLRNDFPHAKANSQAYRTMSSRAIEAYAQDVVDGGSVDTKALVSFFSKEQLTMDLRAKDVSSSILKTLDGQDNGLRAFAPVNKAVRIAARDTGINPIEAWTQLSAAFAEAQKSGGDRGSTKEFNAFWEGQSKESGGLGKTYQAAPGLLWIKRQDIPSLLSNG